jgi:protein-S-isoprenylcysteine O-methyltransferase Ste14
MSIARMMLIVPGTAAYLGLAILGWGGTAAFFAHSALAALAIVLFAPAWAALFANGNLSPGRREDRANCWVIVVFGLIGCSQHICRHWRTGKSSGFLTLTPCAGPAWCSLPPAERRPVFVLGPRFSGLVAIQPGHTLVTDGPFASSAHPSYWGLLINALGWALAFRSVVGVLLAALLLQPLVSRIRAEGRLLRTEFGAEYEAYLAGMWRLLPGTSSVSR